MKTLLKRVLPVILVLALGIIIAKALISSKPKAVVKGQEDTSTLVETFRTMPVQEQIIVDAMGTVIPARELSVSPQVSGQIVELNSNLVPGGFLKAGELIARIDDRDYDAAKKQAWAQVQDARSNLKLEQGRQVVAKREWEFMNNGREAKAEDSALALREPQLANAEARLSSANAAYKKAKLNFERTVITAPFNCVVRNKGVEVGQLVTQQSRIATLVGSDSFWVRVSVPVSHLSWIDLPDAGGDNGASAFVTHSAGNGPLVERAGRVIRLLSDLDPAGRMARLLIEVQDPLGLETVKNLPLMIDAYVRVRIEGKLMDDVHVVARSAVHEGDRLWIMDKDDKLVFRKIQIAWSREREVLVSRGLAAGERIITSRIATPIPGMKLHEAKALPGEVPVKAPAASDSKNKSKARPSGNNNLQGSRP